MVHEFITALRPRLRFFAIIILPILWGVSLFVFLNITSPLRSGPLSVLVAFSLVYLFVASLLYLAMLVIYKIGAFFGWLGPAPRKRLYYLTSVVGLGPVFILALNTLGQLEIKEVILVVLLLLVGSLYVTRRNRKESL